MKVLSLNRGCRLLGVLILLLCSSSLPMNAQEMTAQTPLDSLLTAYDQSQDEARRRAGTALLDFCRRQAVFFDEEPQLGERASTAECDLLVWFAAERFLISTSYFKEALTYIARALPLAASHPDIHCTLFCDRWKSRAHLTPEGKRR